MNIADYKLQYSITYHKSRNFHVMKLKFSCIFVGTTPCRIEACAYIRFNFVNLIFVASVDHKIFLQRKFPDLQYIIYRHASIIKQLDVVC